MKKLLNAITLIICQQKNYIPSFKSIFTHRKNTVCPKPAVCYISLIHAFSSSWQHDCFTNVSWIVHFIQPFILNMCPFFADDDSEPILGLWFEETISPTKDKVAPPPPPPPPPLETSPRLKSPNKQNQSENGNILAGRKDPELVRNTFVCLSDKFLNMELSHNNGADLYYVLLIKILLWQPCDIYFCSL